MADESHYYIKEKGKQKSNDNDGRDMPVEVGRSKEKGIREKIKCECYLSCN